VPVWKWQEVQEVLWEVIQAKLLASMVQLNGSGRPAPAPLNHPLGVLFRGLRRSTVCSSGAWAGGGERPMALRAWTAGISPRWTYAGRRYSKRRSSQGSACLTSWNGVSRERSGCWTVPVETLRPGTKGMPPVRLYDWSIGYFEQKIKLYIRA
jgi:hypothetical protein